MHVSAQLDGLVNDLKEEERQLHFDVTHGILTDEKTLKELAKTDRHLMEKIRYLYYYGYFTNHQKEKILATIKNMRGSLPEVELLVRQLRVLLEHEERFLDYKPGATNKEYVRLRDVVKAGKLVVDKAFLEVRGTALYFNDVLVQGVKFVGSLFSKEVELTVEHYSSEENVLRQILPAGKIQTSEHSLLPGAHHCYFAEPGKLFNKSMNNIRKILGARGAEACITVKIRVPVTHVWVRAKRGSPMKFAIESKVVPISAPKPQKGFRIRLRDQSPEYRAA